MNKINLNIVLKITLAIFIAYQSYKVYSLETKLDNLDKTGQLKCYKPSK